MKYRLTRKSQSDLKYSNIFDTLAVGNFKLNDDIIFYLDEPHLNADNLRHGISIAGIDGKYAELTVLHIYDTTGKLIQTLASTAPTVSMRISGSDIIINNEPFEDQVAHNVVRGTVYLVSDTETGSRSEIFEGSDYTITGSVTHCVCESPESTPPDTYVYESENKYPYYVELPKSYEYKGTHYFEDSVSLGETSKMLVHRFEADSYDLELLYHVNGYINALTEVCPNIHNVSTGWLAQDRVFVAEFETLTQRITLQCLFYQYQNTSLNHGEFRVIEDSKTTEFKRQAFSNNGIVTPKTQVKSDANSVWALVCDDVSSPSGSYATGLRRWPGTMGFIHKLSDGSFFIIDGGVGGKNPDYEDYRSMTGTVMNILRTVADSSNIRISGWLITHMHQDHAGVFCEIANSEEYRSIVQIDKVIYNIPELTHSCVATSSTVPEFKEALANLKATGKTEFVKAHMGQTFVFNNLKLTILAAPDNLYLSTDSDSGEKITNIDKLNDTCIISKVNFCGKDIIYMADSHEINNRNIVRPLLLPAFKGIYGLQVAHHGYVDTGSELLYADLFADPKVQPELIIWPVCYEHYSGKTVDGRNYIEGGERYEGVKSHSKNAALTSDKFTHIYPVYNFTMIGSPQIGASWKLMPKDFN